MEWMSMTNPKDANAVLKAIYEELAGFFTDAEEAREIVRAEPSASSAPSVAADVCNKNEVSPSSTPWSNLDGISETNLLYTIPPEVVAKMEWVIDNVPKMNKQRIVREAVMVYLDSVIARHYKP
jgi:hypothetical protein